MTNERVLIVEDNDLLRESLQEMLTYEGFNVVTARNGAEALDRMNTLTPELIVSDITMPVMNGYEFYNHIRSHSEWVTIPFLFLSSHDEASEVLTSKNLGVDDYLIKPISREELVSVIRSRIDRFQQVQMAQIRHAYQATLTIVANAIEMRSPDSNQHVEHITNIVQLLAKRMGWQENRLLSLRFGAILHDIGKIHISANILVKQGTLNRAEWAEVQRHPITGADMIKGIPLLGGAVPIVLNHHKRWDGKGYPDGLRGTSISEGARILSVVDSFIVMITTLPYRLARSPQEAIQEIQSLSGINYDPRVVGTFESAWEAGEIQAILRQHS